MMSNKLLLDFIKIKGMLLSDHVMDEGKVDLTEFSLTGFHLCMWVGCGTIHVMIMEDFVDERFTDPEDLAYFFDRERKFEVEDWNASFEVTGCCGVATRHEI
jgi:hypothetical protein